MECNKEEARRAMVVAERKLSKKDYNGAKKSISKAHKLYPKLDGLIQLSTMVDVYVSASNPNKRGGGGVESDWYGILGLDPSADDIKVKKQYKKFALLLHPDKNKFHGAKEAFELVSDAWCVLSDHSKRAAYDQQRNYKEKQEKRDASCSSSETTEDANNQAQENTKQWFDESQEWVAAALARARAEEAERLFIKNRMKRANENSTAEAERLFKRPVLTTRNANSTSEAERLFRNPMNAENGNSTSEAKRLFGRRP